MNQPSLKKAKVMLLTYIEAHEPVPYNTHPISQSVGLSKTLVRRLIVQLIEDGLLHVFTRGGTGNRVLAISPELETALKPAGACLAKGSKSGCTYWVDTLNSPKKAYEGWDRLRPYDKVQLVMTPKTTIFQDATLLHQFLHQCPAKVVFRYVEPCEHEPYETQLFNLISAQLYSGQRSRYQPDPSRRRSHCLISQNPAHQVTLEALAQEAGLAPSQVMVQSHFKW